MHAAAVGPAVREPRQRADEPEGPGPRPGRQRVRDAAPDRRERQLRPALHHRAERGARRAVERHHDRVGDARDLPQRRRDLAARLTRRFSRVRIAVVHAPGQRQVAVRVQEAEVARRPPPVDVARALDAPAESRIPAICQGLRDPDAPGLAGRLRRRRMVADDDLHARQRPANRLRAHRGGGPGVHRDQPRLRRGVGLPEGHAEPREERVEHGRRPPGSTGRRPAARRRAR